MKKTSIFFILLLPFALNGMQTPNLNDATAQTTNVDSDQESDTTTIPGDGGVADIADLEEAIEQCQGVKG